MTQYKTFEEWLKDYKVYQENPEDKKFLKAFQSRTNNSKREIQRQVKVFLQSLAMESNPMETFNSVMKEVSTEFYLLVKSQEDPWFNA